MAVLFYFLSFDIYFDHFVDEKVREIVQFDSASFAINTQYGNSCL